MTPDWKTGGFGTAQRMRAGLMALITTLGIAGAGTSALAQSAYSCRSLETHAALPAVEGEGGLFLSIRPELQAHHSIADQTVAQIASLGKALAANGTTLVMLPVPTRAQVLAHRLPVMAAHLGYDADASTAVHKDMVKRLRDAGLTVADARPGLRALALAGGAPYFGVDPRPTAPGARVLAQAVGAELAEHPALRDVDRSTYTTTEGSEVAVKSAMRVQLQTACQNELPAAVTPSFTTKLGGATGFGGTAQPSAAAGVARLVLLGSEITATTQLNLIGFISEATGLETQSYGVPQGGAYAAISSYLTSADFRANPPKVVVWEWPVTAPLGNNGDQPMQELIMAASDSSCSTPLALTRAPAGNALRAALTPIGPEVTEATLALDTGGAAVPFVRFHFTGADGLIRTRSIYRHPGQVLTGRFYLPLAGLDTQALQGVEIQAPGAFGTAPSLSACFAQKE